MCFESILRVPVESGQGNQAHLEFLGNRVFFQIEAGLLGTCSSFKVSPAPSGGMTGTSGFLSLLSRGIDPHLELRSGKKGLSLNCGLKLGVPLAWGQVSRGISGVAEMVSSTLSNFRMERMIQLETLLWTKA